MTVWIPGDTGFARERARRLLRLLGAARRLVRRAVATRGGLGEAQRGDTHPARHRQVLREL